MTLDRNASADLVNRLLEGGALETIVDDAGKAAFVKAQSVYRAGHDHFPLKSTWETAGDGVRDGWREIAYAAIEAAYMPPLGTQPEPRKPRDVKAALEAAALPEPVPAEVEGLCERLDKAAAEATKGEWSVDGYNMAAVIFRQYGKTHVTDWHRLARCDDDNANWKADAAFIALASPDNISKLLATIRALAAENGRLQIEIDAAKRFGGGFFGEVSEAVRDAYRDGSRRTLAEGEG